MRQPDERINNQILGIKGLTALSKQIILKFSEVKKFTYPVWVQILPVYQAGERLFFIASKKMTQKARIEVP